MTRAAVAGLVGSLTVAVAASAQQSDRLSPRSAPPVTAADLIGMTLFGSDPHNGGWEEDAHQLSPDGAHVAVVLQRGDLATNTVDYSLVVFPTAAGLGTRGDTVAALSSATNDPAISGVHWFADNRRIAFLGAPGREAAQVYTVDITTRALTARTHSATGVTSFEIGPAGEPLIYQQQDAVDTTQYGVRRAHGFVVSPKSLLSDLIAGDWLDGGPKYALRYPRGYRIASDDTDTALTLPDSTSGHKSCELASGYGPPVGARDVLLLSCQPVTTPAMWKGYRNATYRLWVDKFEDYGHELVLFDPITRGTHLATTAPLRDEANFVWAPDRRSLLVANTLLPLTGPDSGRRVTHAMAAEIDLATGAITLVAPRDSLVVQQWDARTGLVDFAVAAESWMVTGATQHVYYQKTARGWTEVPSARAGMGARPRFVIDQGPNSPPRLALVDAKTQSRRVVFDPNPELLAARRFAHAAVFHWTTRGGHAYAGGLYVPPDSATGGGRRYPLVIQTHGYDSTKFAPEGVFTTDQAAQQLANAGIIVLQAEQKVGADRAEVESMESSAEGPFVQEIYEGAIDALDRAGLIDRSKVGLQGFSRTCFYTLYFLTHSSYPIAAVDITDGVDYSYFQSLAFMMKADKINGGLPWGSSQAAWLERASGFRLDRVTAPLRVTALGRVSLLSEWEPYAGLLLQGKPAELVYIPDGAHVLIKPWERLTSQQGVVDWWRFWLQGYEDPDPAKAEQYQRWHKLGAQRDSSAVSSTSPR